MIEVSITIEDIVRVHDKSLLRYGGLPGIRQEGCLEQTLGNAMLAEQYSGNDDGSLGLCFIGSLMYYLIKDQCFADGNKRTALGVVLEMLSVIGLTLGIEQIAMKDYCEEVAINNKTTSGDVVRWLARTVVQLGSEELNGDSAASPSKES